MQAGLTTDELLARLRGLGLSVSRDMLSKDVSAGYLPGPEMCPRGPGRGIGRSWTHETYVRAKYLYRLRKLGARGERLRLLMFLRDGWGWEGVRPICRAFLKKTIKFNRGLLNRRVRGAQPRADVEMVLHEVQADSGIRVDATAGYVFGVGRYGAPLDGGSIGPLLRSARDSGLFFDGADFDDQALTSIEDFLTWLNLNWHDVLDAIETADAEVAECARVLAVGAIKAHRQGLLSQGVPAQHSNPLTCYGSDPATLASDLRKHPARFTASQWLAMPIAVATVGLRLAQLRFMQEGSADFK